MIAEAQGEAARFLSVYNEYKNAKDVTRERIFLETMEQILGDTNKVVIEGRAKAAAAWCPICRFPKFPENAKQN